MIVNVISTAEEFDLPVIFVGDGVFVHKDKLEKNDNFFIAPANCNMPRAASVAVGDEELIKDGKFINGKDFAPVYLRKTRAERELEEKTPGAEYNMFKIIPMEEKHIDDVANIEEKCFHMPWTRSDFEKEIKENKMAIYYVAVDDNGNAVGYAGMWHVVTEGQITNVAVLTPIPGYRRWRRADKVDKRSRGT